MCLRLIRLTENYDNGIYEMLQEIPQNFERTCSHTIDNQSENVILTFGKINLQIRTRRKENYN